MTKNLNLKLTEPQSSNNDRWSDQAFSPASRLRRLRQEGCWGSMVLAKCSIHGETSLTKGWRADKAEESQASYYVCPQ